MAPFTNHANRDDSAVKRTLLTVAAALGLGLVFDILFFGKLPGVSFPIYAALAMAALMLAALRQGKELPKAALFMIPLILFFSSMVYVRANELLTLVNIVITLYLGGLFIALVARPKLKNYNFEDYLGVIFKLPVGLARKFGDGLKPLLAQRGFAVRHKEMAHVIRGILIALPVLLLFAALFSSADLVFREYLNNIFDFNLSSDLFWQIFWLLLVAGIFVGAFGLLGERPAAENRVIQKAGTTKFGHVETGILFGSLNVLFLAFITVQLTYLFGGVANVVGGEFTYAEYARKGFFELIAVAGLSLLLLFAAERLLLREREKHDIRFKVLSGLLIAQVLIIMASAVKRLHMYEGAYGFTSPRLFAYIFIAWLAVVFAALLYKILAARRENEFAFAVFVSVLALLATVNFLNVDALVARKNIDRYQATGKLDIRYLEDLSDDAIAEVAGLLESEDERLRDNLAASFYQRRLQLQAKDDVWQSANLTRQAALRELDKYSGLLAQNKDKLADPGYRGPGQ